MTDKDQRMEELLRRLPAQMAFPTTPDIAARIGDVLPERPAPRKRPSVIWASVAVAIAAILLVVLLPGPRNAVAGWLGLPGIRIEFVDRHSSDNEATSIGSSLLFGEQTTLAEAQDALSFTVYVPVHADLAAPDEAWLRDSSCVRAISLIYGARGDLPEIGDTGVGMLLMEFQTREEAPYIAKRSMGEGTFRVVTINEKEGYWIENGELVVLPPEGQPAQTRRSGNVLIWSDRGTTFRLETSLDQEEAIRIVESLVPYETDATGNQSGGWIVKGVPGGMMAARDAAARRRHHETHVYFTNICSGIRADARRFGNCRRLGGR